jgi:Uma2 family endonuclease
MLTEEIPKIRPSTSELIVEPSDLAKVITQNPPRIAPPPVITWEKLPDDFILPDDPVDNINQPSIAAAINDGLNSNNRLPANALVCTDYGIIATVEGKTIAKAPDWAYIANINASYEEIDRSYTPHLHGEVPTIVIEMLSATDGTEFSMRPDSPMGKWYFYEQILKVPYYGIFEPKSGDFQVYILNPVGRYDRLIIEESGRYWIEPLQLSIASWKGKRENRDGYWLRWWDAEGNLLLWASEINEKNQAELRVKEAEIEAAKAEVEAAKAEVEAVKTESAMIQERAKASEEQAERLAQQLRDLGIEPQ